MKFARIETPGLAHYAYVIADGNQAAVIDPSRHIEPYLRAARELGATIVHVVETHRQEDFVMGAAALARETGATIVNGDHPLFGHGDIRLNDGETFTLGRLTIRALATPGHTPESMSYAVYPPEHPDQAWCVFTGDTLFFGTTGRTDLTDADRARENAELLYDSVHGKLAPLGDPTLVFPAHTAGSICGVGMAQRPVSTIGMEQRYNEVFTFDRAAFARRKAAEQLPRPPYFRLMEKVNLAGGIDPVIRPGNVPLFDVDSFAAAAPGGVLIDTREPEAYAGGHIEDSYAIWLEGVPMFASWFADLQSPIYLVTDRVADVDTAAMYLSYIGLDNVQAALAEGFDAWRKSGEPIERSGVITPRDLVPCLDQVQVLDVRQLYEFEEGHIPGALHMPVVYLEERLDELGLRPDQPVVVLCSVGHRGGLGVSILRRAGFEDVRNLLGGMTAWTKLGLPTQ